MKYIDLFAGVGGFHYGIDSVYVDRGEERGVETNTAGNEGQGLQPEARQNNATPNRRISERITNELDERPLCVYSNEWDKYANSVYRRHYGECDNRDIRTVKASEIPDFDLLCGGFPCQAFSVAGKRGGFDDTRGTLFFEIARILKEKQPRLCLLENVKGLLSHDTGRTFKVILTTLTELGYDVQWQVLNSKNFGVPQNRERVYIVGHLRGTPRPQVFPITSSNAAPIQKGNVEPISGTLSTKNQSGQAQWDGSTTLISKTVRIGGVGSPHGSKQNWDSYEVGSTIRRLTPTECERLQGFPDGWTAIDADGKPVSDTQRYKMMGNAVTTNVVTEVVKRMFYD